jgi:hypothetical protein
MIIHHGEIAMDPAKVKGILEWPQPKNLTEVRSFLGFCNFYRTFITQYSTIACPLIDLTKKDTPFSWTETQSSAFESLCSSFASSPILKNPDPSHQFAIASNASLVATGAVLLQKDENGSYHPYSYLSQSLSPAERNYQIYD